MKVDALLPWGLLAVIAGVLWWVTAGTPPVEVDVDWWFVVGCGLLAVLVSSTSPHNRATTGIMALTALAALGFSMAGVLSGGDTLPASIASAIATACVMIVAGVRFTNGWSRSAIIALVVVVAIVVAIYAGFGRSVAIA